MLVVAKGNASLSLPFKSESHLAFNRRIDGEIQKCKAAIVSTGNFKKIEEYSFIILHPAYA